MSQAGAPRRMAHDIELHLKVVPLLLNSSGRIAEYACGFFRSQMDGDATRRRQLVAVPGVMDGLVHCIVMQK